MKKTILILLSIVLLSLSAFILVACDKEETYTGEYSYVAYGSTYGVKVDVTVKADKITAVKLYSDEESGMILTTLSWAFYEQTEAAYADYVKQFVGKSVSEVKAIDVTKSEGGAPSAISGNIIITGATQSSGRIILAIQDALSKI